MIISTGLSFCVAGLFAIAGWRQLSSTRTTKQTFPDLVPFIVTCAGIIAALYYGQGILRPLALAVMITVLLGASTEKLTRIEIGAFQLRPWQGLAVSIGLAIAAVVLIANILTGQVDDLSAAWPRYVVRFEEIIAKISAVLGTDIAEKIEGQIGRLDLSSSVSKIAGTAGSVLAELGLVVLYVAFLLSARSSNAQKLIALFPLEKERTKISLMLASMAESTRNYMLIKTATSLLTGVVSYAVMKFMGLDFAETWALLIFLLNFIPTIGSVTAVIFPSLLALAQFETLMPFLVIAGLLTSVQFTIGNLIEPILMGRTLNLSSLVVFLALAFWGALWGIAGMLMSVPSTVLLMIFCAHVPRLQWMAILLSEDGKINQNAA